MNEIIIDEEFKGLLPALDEQTYTWLEENILQYGCREPITLWNGIIIDGYNRYDILTKHDLSVNTVSMEFDSRDDVIIWIIDNQVSRRNLTPIQLSYYRGLHYNTDKRVIRNMTGKNQHSEVISQNGKQPKMQSTVSKLADKYNVSARTISRDSQIANAINTIGETSPEAKKDILSGKQHISRRQLQELAGGTEDDVSAIVAKITEGTFESRRSATTSGGLKSGGFIDSVGMRPWELQFTKMTDEFRSLMRNHAKADDTTAAKSTLKQYIGMLEELYRSI